MPTPDLSTLNLDELKALAKNVEKAIASYELRRRQEALAAAKAAAAEHGFNLQDIVDDRPTGRRSRSPISPPRYRHPEHPEKTWTGRGRPPKWFDEALANGASEQDLLIQPV